MGYKSIRISSSRLRYEDDNGLPAIGYVVWTCLPETTTPADTWSDRALTSLNANPIVLDSRGECELWTNATRRLLFCIPTSASVGDGVILDDDYLGDVQDNFVTGIATPVTLHNNYVVTTVPTIAALSENFTLIMTPDVDNADTIVSNTFTGTGNNDCTAAGPYVGSTAGSIFHVEIDGALEAPPTAPTAAENAAAGLVTVGNHYVKITFVTAIGETALGAASGVVAAAGSKKIDVTDIPVGSAQVTARNVYMTKAGGTDYFYVDQVPDNSTTTYTISIADASLTVAAPTEDTTGSGNTFSWRKDAGSDTAGVVITGVVQSLIEGVTVSFATITGHTLGDYWSILVETPARVNLDTLGNLLVYKNKGGSIVALDGSDMVAGYPAQLILNAALNAWLLINPATPTFSTPTITAIRYRKNLIANYNLLLSDQGYELSCDGTFTITLLTCPEFSGRFVYIKNAGTGIITIDAGIYTIHGTGATTYGLGPGGCVQINTNGVDWHVTTSIGNLVLVETVFPSTAASVTFSNLLPGFRYKLIGQLLASNDTHLYLRFNADGGATYYFSASEVYAGAYHAAYTGFTSFYIATAVYRTTEVSLDHQFEAWLSNSHRVNIFGGCAYYRTSVVDITLEQMAGIYVGSEDLSSLTITPSAGTVTGRVSLYQYI